MSRPLSLTARLTLLFASMSAAVLLVFAWVIATAIDRHFVDLDRDEIAGKLLLVRNEIDRLDAADGLEELPARLHDAIVGHQNLLLTVRLPDGRHLYQTPAGSIPDALLSPAGSLFEWTQDGRHFRGMSETVASRVDAGHPLTVAVGLDTVHHAMFMARFKRTLATFVVVATLASGLLGWLAARSGLAPLRAMKSKAAIVTAQKLDLRLPSGAVPVEIADLAAALNEMLARLEQAFVRLSEFSSDLAHELRTPIGNLTMQTQVALSQARSAEDYRDILASNAEEFERLGRMVSDMLFLAKAEHGLMLPAPEHIELAREIDALFEFYDALAEEKRVRLVRSGAATMTGDRLMIRRALSNLLSNAIRHTPAEGEIEVSVRTEHDGIAVAVSNPGQCIDPAQLPRLFERFYRSDAARAHGDDHGAGLGLAIVKAIVAAHRGRITASSGGGQTRFEMLFPR